MPPVRLLVSPPSHTPSSPMAPHLPRVGAGGVWGEIQILMKQPYYRPWFLGERGPIYAKFQNSPILEKLVHGFFLKEPNFDETALLYLVKCSRGPN